MRRRAGEFLEWIEAKLEVVYLLCRRRHRGGLVIFDDLFPWLGTGFRVSEFNGYFRAFDTCIAYSTQPHFGGEMRRYRRRFPEYAKRIFRFRSERRFEGRLAYIVFLHNAARFLPTMEAYKLPFVLELYPGGEFRLDDTDSDDKLRRVCRSPCLERIIVTQSVTMKYLLGKGFCAEAMLHYIYGSVVQLPDVTPQRNYWGKGKRTFDICFTGYRQMPLGRDKGYDVFIDVAKRLSRADTRFRFHVVGDFGAKDIDCSCLGDTIRFYGRQTTDFFPSYYRDKDLILSPNRPFVLASGAFDGIPTAAVVEAGACGVAMFCTDELSLTEGIFEAGTDIVIVRADAETITAQIMDYVRRPDALYEIGRRGKLKIETVFSPTRQLGARLALLAEILSSIPARGGA